MAEAQETNIRAASITARNLFIRSVPPYVWWNRKSSNGGTPSLLLSSAQKIKYERIALHGTSRDSRQNVLLTAQRFALSPGKRFGSLPFRARSLSGEGLPRGTDVGCASIPLNPRRGLNSVYIVQRFCVLSIEAKEKYTDNSK